MLSHDFCEVADSPSDSANARAATSRTGDRRAAPAVQLGMTHNGHSRDRRRLDPEARTTPTAARASIIASSARCASRTTAAPIRCRRGSARSRSGGRATTRDRVPAGGSSAAACSCRCTSARRCGCSFGRRAARAQDRHRQGLRGQRRAVDRRAAQPRRRTTSSPAAAVARRHRVGQGHDPPVRRDAARHGLHRRGAGHRRGEASAASSSRRSRRSPGRIPARTTSTISSAASPCRAAAARDRERRERRDGPRARAADGAEDLSRSVRHRHLGPRHAASRVFVHIVNSELWRDITGEAPPPTPVTARSYSERGPALVRRSTTSTRPTIAPDRDARRASSRSRRSTQRRARCRFRTTIRSPCRQSRSSSGSTEARSGLTMATGDTHLLARA